MQTDHQLIAISNRAWVYRFFEQIVGYVEVEASICIEVVDIWSWRHLVWRGGVVVELQQRLQCTTRAKTRNSLQWNWYPNLMIDFQSDERANSNIFYSKNKTSRVRVLGHLWWRYRVEFYNLEGTSDHICLPYDKNDYYEEWTCAET